MMPMYFLKALFIAFLDDELLAVVDAAVAAAPSTGAFSSTMTSWPHSSAPMTAAHARATAVAMTRGRTRSVFGSQSPAARRTRRAAGQRAAEPATAAAAAPAPFRNERRETPLPCLCHAVFLPPAR